ncbi:DNA-binding protein [bacterium]|nr:DNA-binding protein [bacterium]
MQRVTTKQAAAELNMDIETLQYLLRQERLPIGYAVKREGAKRGVYIIYRGMLDQFKKSIAGGEG